MNEYQIQASSRKCCSTGRVLKDGEKYYSVLLEQLGKLVRQDYSVEAWQGPPEGSFGFWMGTVATPESRQSSRKLPPIDDEMLMECFHRLEGWDPLAPGVPAPLTPEGRMETGEAAGNRVRFRYILALLLMRRRRFRFEETQQEAGQEVMVLRCTRTGTETRVVNPCLSEQEMMTVQDEVLQTLGWE